MNLTRPGLLRTASRIGARWVSGGEGHAVCDPATGEEIARVHQAGADEAREAVDAASEALPAWSGLLAQERSAIVGRWGDLMLAHVEDLARLMTAEQGKPLAEARGEIRYAASFLHWFAEEAHRLYGEIVPSRMAGARVLVLRQPVGVVAAITPWNFPAAMITRKAGAALAAGCTMVVKPSELTPLSALALAVLAEEAGVPPGVLNVISGRSSEIGGAWMSDPRVRKLSFTGSQTVGQLLMRQAADTLKRVSLELGGNAPFLVFDDADLEAAVRGAVASKFRNSGQTCVCANRFYVQAGIHDTFVAALAAEVGRLRVGPGDGEGVDQGPLISEAALTKVERHVADAVEKGARVVVGGARHPRGGNFYLPTVLTGASRDMAISCEETFGPVAAVWRFQTEAEAVALANDTEAGLAAYCYTRDLGRAWRVAEALEVGMVGINEGLISTAVAPFGGVKASGMGREGSRHGLEDYVQLKYVLMGGIGR